MSKKKPSPMDILNQVRNKAKLDNSNFANSFAINLVPGKIKFQLLALTPDNLFIPRTQHFIPRSPDSESSDEKALVADCAGDGCPVCAAADKFKAESYTVENVNEMFPDVKYPYKTVKSLFTQKEHCLLCARILADDADKGNYLPKDGKIGDTYLLKFNKMALNNLMSAYEDFIDDYSDSINGEEDSEDVPPLFAIFDGEDSATSLVVTCRITNQPYSCSFTFNKPTTVSATEVNKDKLELLENGLPKVPDEHYQKCVERIDEIRHCFFNKYHTMDIDMPDMPFSMDDDSSEEGPEDTIDESDLDLNL